MEKQLFPLLLSNGVEPIIISGSQQEALETYKERLGFKRAYGLKFKKGNGQYTDKCILNTAISEGKQRAVKALTKEPNTRILLGFGDAIADIPLLVHAQQGFVNSPQEFLTHGKLHYLDFSDERSGDRMIELILPTLERMSKEGPSHDD